MRGRQSHAPRGIQIPAAIFNCRGCLQPPILITKPLLLAAWSAQTHSLQQPGDVLLGQNGLILGQRGNLLVLERYLRKLVSDWDGLLTRSQGEVEHTSMGPFQGHWCWMLHRGALVGMEWLGTHPPLISMSERWTMSQGWVFVLGGECKLELLRSQLCVAAWLCSPLPCSLLAQPEAMVWGSAWRLVLLSYPSCASAAPFPLQE